MVVNIVLVVNLMVQVVLEEVVMEEILLVLLEQQTQVLVEELQIMEVLDMGEVEQEDIEHQLKQYHQEQQLQ